MNNQAQLIHRLERNGLRVQRSFAWQTANCPTHKMMDCDCETAIYLVYGDGGSPATLMMQTQSGRTRIKLDQSVRQRVSAEFQTQILSALHAA